MYSQLCDSNVRNAILQKSALISISRGVDKEHVYMYATGYYSALKKRSAVSEQQRKLENIMLSKINQVYKHFYCLFSLTGETNRRMITPKLEGKRRERGHS